jgi:hypothetical protein
MRLKVTTWSTNARSTSHLRIFQFYMWTGQLQTSFQIQWLWVTQEKLLLERNVVYIWMRWKDFDERLWSSQSTCIKLLERQPSLPQMQGQSSKKRSLEAWLRWYFHSKSKHSGRTEHESCAWTSNGQDKVYRSNSLSQALYSAFSSQNTACLGTTKCCQSIWNRKTEISWGNTTSKSKSRAARDLKGTRYLKS